MDALNRLAPTLRSVLRIVAGLIFLAHGTQKIFGFPASEFSPPVFSIFWTAGIVELAIGTLLILGLLTRPAAFIASGMMAVAYWMVHAPQSPFPVLNGGDAAILYCFVFLYLVFAGPGPLSVDAAMGKDR